MIHYFDENVAVDVGINAAILYKNIQYWCEKNRTNNQNEHDGYFWSYNSISAFCEQFPYLSEKQIRLALKTLEERGYIKTGNYNHLAYDRTKWYADVRLHTDEKANCICPVGQMESSEKANGISPEGEPIPNNYQITTKDNGYIYEEKSQKKRFVPPTLEEVQAYCEERNNNVIPQKFIDYYSSNGWKVGKNKMVDWKASVRTWERNQISNDPEPKSQKPSSFVNPFEELERELGYDTERIDPALKEIIGKLPECNQ